MDKEHIVVLTGAGMSAESGIRTFREAGGLWEEHDVMEVASPQGWEKNPQLVLRFYNERREQLKNCQPNQGHRILHELEEHFKVSIITQNVDDLHERAGSSSVLHLHGLLTEARSVANDELIVSVGYQSIQWGDTATDGQQLRPNIVWFGEAVPAIPEAQRICSQADRLIVIGTSLSVYPAANLIYAVRPHTPVTLIDPNPSSVHEEVEIIQAGAGEGLQSLKEQWVCKK